MGFFNKKTDKQKEQEYNKKIEEETKKLERETILAKRQTMLAEKQNQLKELKKKNWDMSTHGKLFNKAVTGLSSMGKANENGKKIKLFSDDSIIGKSHFGSNSFSESTKRNNPFENVNNDNMKRKTKQSMQTRSGNGFNFHI